MGIQVKPPTNMPVKVLYNFTQHLEEYSLLCRTLSKFQLTHLIIVHFLLESDQNNFVQDRNHEIYSGTLSRYLIFILSNILSTEEILVQFPLPKNKKIKLKHNNLCTQIEIIFITKRFLSITKDNFASHFDEV